MPNEPHELQPLLSSAVNDLHTELHDLHHRAGRPSWRAIGRDVGRSHTTVSKIFADPTSSTWQGIRDVISTLGGDANYFRKIWYHATGGAQEQGVSNPQEGEFRNTRGDALVPKRARIGDWLLTELEAQIGLPPDTEAMQRLYLADDLTLLACRLQLQDDLREHYGMPAALPGRSHVRVGNHILRCNVEADSIAERAMRVTLHDQWMPMEQHLTEELAIGQQSGRFNRLSLTAPGPLLDWLVETCANRTTALITSAYRWLEQTIAQSASLLSSPFEEKALQLFRKCLPSRLVAGPVAGSLFLVLVTRGRVSYAIDETAIRDALLAAQSNPKHEYVPAIAVGDMFFNSIPFSHSFSRRAMNGDRSVLVDLSRAPYQRIAQDYLLAETAIHRGHSLLVPVAKAPDLSILAGYPTGISSSLPNAISDLRAELAPYAASAGAALRSPIICRTGRSAHVLLH